MHINNHGSQNRPLPSLTDGDSEKRRADQNALNAQFLREKINQVHASLCPEKRGSWQERAEQAVAAAERLAGKSQ